jgi:hypothetical protein
VREGKGWADGGEMTQTLYVHMNKKKEGQIKSKVSRIKEII